MGSTRFVCSTPACRALGLCPPAVPAFAWIPPHADWNSLRLLTLTAPERRKQALPPSLRLPSGVPADTREIRQLNRSPAWKNPGQLPARRPANSLPGEENVVRPQVKAQRPLGLCLQLDGRDRPQGFVFPRGHLGQRRAKHIVDHKRHCLLIFGRSLLLAQPVSAGLDCALAKHHVPLTYYHHAHILSLKLRTKSRSVD